MAGKKTLTNINIVNDLKKKAGFNYDGFSALCQCSLTVILIGLNFSHLLYIIHLNLLDC